MLRPMMLCVLAAASAAASPLWAADTARCAVWQRELSFAHAVEQHDEAGFASHIETDAVFAANTTHPQRGRDTIVKQWKALLEGKSLRVRWYPASVVQAGDPDVSVRETASRAAWGGWHRLPPQRGASQRPLPCGRRRRRLTRKNRAAGSAFWWSAAQGGNRSPCSGFRHTRHHSA